MKYIKNIISFFIPTINYTVDNFNKFYDSLQEETEIFIENMDSYYLEGILNCTLDRSSGSASIANEDDAAIAIDIEAAFEK